MCIRDSLHEEVEAENPLVLQVVGVEELLHVLWRQSVPKGREGGGELGKGDCAGVVDVEAVEEGAPGGEEGPEGAVSARRGISEVCVRSGWKEKKFTRTRRSQSCQSDQSRTCYRLSATSTPSKTAYLFSHRIIILTVCGSNTV